MTAGPISATIRINRRWFLVGGGAALAGPVLGRPSFALAADAHRFAQGAVEATVLSDGHLVLPAAILAPSAPPEEFAALMTEIHGKVPETIEPAANVALLRSGDDLVLVDTGSGDKFQPTAGKLLENLRANAIDPASVTKVVFTHAHPDHVWGTLLDDGSLAFPNAGYYVGQAEWDFWTDPELPGKMPEDLRPFALGAQRDLGAVKERVTMVQDGAAVAAGISVIDAPGHTPGHLALFVDGGDGLIIGGDLAAHPVVSTAHPDWAFGFDADAERAIATRKALLDRAATDGTSYLGFHFPYPGVGKVERTGSGYRFVPAG
jgi:glyoxylase-like metal-dependent hydrolase (beta-lactamase superfamily II)